MQQHALKNVGITTFTFT